MEPAVSKMLARHRESDTAPADERQTERDAKRIERLQQAKQLKDWLTEHLEDRKGAKGGVRKSNLTDRESAQKAATGKGMIQGYTGVAAVDEKPPIIVDAQAHGSGPEQELLLPVVEALMPQRGSQTSLTAEAGYHSEAGLKALVAAGIDAYIPDQDYRKRDERYRGRKAPRPNPTRCGISVPRRSSQTGSNRRIFSSIPTRKPACVQPVNHSTGIGVTAQSAAIGSSSSKGRSETANRACFVSGFYTGEGVAFRTPRCAIRSPASSSVIPYTPAPAAIHIARFTKRSIVSEAYQSVKRKDK